MDTLIKSVVPPVGSFCLTTIYNGKPSQAFFDNKDDLVAAGIAASDAGRNSYYAMAAFKDDSSRTQGNVLALKAFWLDVDCKNKDPEKDYADKAEGIAAIQAFCKSHSFPKPTIVDSGNGWHVYWILTEAITPEQWQPVADKLKAMCLQGGLRIDPACTADSARILRIPGTKNYRFDPPSDVVLVLESSEVFFDAFAAIVDTGYASLGAPPSAVLSGTPTKKQLSAVTKALLGNTTSSFKKIVQKCAAGTGCQQIMDGITDQENVEEPVWRGLLSVAQCCTDASKAIHLISNQHPEYDPTATEKKAAETKGPYTCATFDGLRSGVCTKCPHWGKITSPIQLGKEVVASTGPVVVQVAAPQPVAQAVQQAPDTIEFDASEADAALATFNQNIQAVLIPNVPRPYLRGQNGGIYKRVTLEDGTFDDVLIYENDFYVHARLYDPDEGQVLACRLHLPMDGIRNFNIPLKSVGSKDELRRAICSRGVAASDRTIAELSYYLIAMTKEIQQMQKEEKARVQMGWQTDNTLVVGDREYSTTGIRHCPPSTATMNHQHKFRIEGSLTNWRKVIDLYNAPGFEVHQFVLFYMMASPLLRFVGHNGMLVNLLSDEGGLGKSTLGELCNSVWGHPRELTAMPRDTKNAIMNQFGVHNSLGVYMDEVTNHSPEAVSDLLYGVTHGKDRERLQGNLNATRVNNTTWGQHFLSSSNSSLVDKVSSIKASAEGEVMRILEFDMRGTPVLEKAVADAIFPLMLKNYGVAGHHIASWLVQNVNVVEPMVKRTQRELDKKFKFNHKERMWSLSVACAYTMAAVSRSLGLHNFSISDNIDFMITRIDQMRNSVKANITKHDGILADFLVENHSSVLIIDGLPDVNGLQAPPRNRSINKIIARYEPDTGKLFISAKEMREYCTRRQFSFDSFKMMTGARTTTRRLSAGSGVVAGPVGVLQFDTKVNGIDISLWSDMETTDDSEST